MCEKQAFIREHIMTKIKLKAIENFNFVKSMSSKFCQKNN